LRPPRAARITPASHVTGIGYASAACCRCCTARSSPTVRLKPDLLNHPSISANELSRTFGQRYFDVETIDRQRRQCPAEMILFIVRILAAASARQARSSCGKHLERTRNVKLRTAMFAAGPPTAMPLAWSSSRHPKDPDWDHTVYYNDPISVGGRPADLPIQVPILHCGRGARSTSLPMNAAKP